MEIREEKSEDATVIFQINKAAFGRSDEARLVDRLRDRKAIIHSLTAEWHGEVVGHAMVSPVMLQKDDGVVTVVAGLGPIAVLPTYQKQGIGSALIDAGTKLCGQAGYRIMIVLGHPSYYPRFGFQPARRFDISSAYDVPDDAFMVLELQNGALQALNGVAYYHPEFDGV